MINGQERFSGIPMPRVERRGLAPHERRSEVLRNFRSEIRMSQADIREGNKPQPIIYYPVLLVDVMTLDPLPAVREFDQAVNPRRITQNAQLNVQTQLREALLKDAGFELNEEGLSLDHAQVYDIKGRSVIAHPSLQVPGLWVCRVVEPEEKGEKKGVVFENITVIDPSKTPQDYK